MGKTKRYVVTKCRKTPYSEPIAIAKGELVRVGDEYAGEESWAGWIWCETENAKCWVPCQIIEKKDKGFGILKEGYVATELNVEVGEILEAERELNGWVWAHRLDTTQFGWVPLDILRQTDKKLME